MGLAVKGPIAMLRIRLKACLRALRVPKYLSICLRKPSGACGDSIVRVPRSSTAQHRVFVVSVHLESLEGC